MEELFKQILSEHWIIALMFIWTLYFIIRALKWWISNYLIIVEKHNSDFLSAFNKMIEANNGVSESILNCSNNNSKEHESLMSFITEKHDHNEKSHVDLANMIELNNKNIKITHKSVLELHDKIITEK